MFETLKNIGFSDEAQDLLIEKYGFAEIMSMAARPEIVVDNLQYLNELGFKNISDIIFNKLYVIRRTTDLLKKSDIKNHVEEINNDIDLIDKYL